MSPLRPMKDEYMSRQWLLLKRSLHLCTEPYSIQHPDYAPRRQRRIDFDGRIYRL